MDALPIQEQTGLPYESVNQGYMHSCGHDFILAAALILAKIIAEEENEEKKSCELKDQLFLSLVNSIMGTEIACRVIQNVVQKSGAAAQIFTLTFMELPRKLSRSFALRLKFSPSRSISSAEYPLLAAACFAKSRS